MKPSGVKKTSSRRTAKKVSKKSVKKKAAKAGGRVKARAGGRVGRPQMELFDEAPAVARETRQPPEAKTAPGPAASTGPPPVTRRAPSARATAQSMAAACVLCIH